MTNGLLLSERKKNEGEPRKVAGKKVRGRKVRLRVIFSQNYPVARRPSTSRSDVQLNKFVSAVLIHLRNIDRF